MPKSKAKGPRPVPSLIALEYAALKLHLEMLEKEPVGGKLPSVQAVRIAAKIMARRAFRELTAEDIRQRSLMSGTRRYRQIPLF